MTKIKDELKNVKFKINPKINWSEWKNPKKMIDLDKTSFDIKFKKDIKDKDIQLKLEVNGNASIFTSGINDENFQFKPTVFGKLSIKDKTVAGDLHFDYQIQPDINMNGKITGGKIHLGFDKDLTGEDVVLSFNIDGKIEEWKSTKGNASLVLSIKS